MDSVDLEVIRTALKWVRAGHRATLGTVTHTWGSAPRPVGAMMVIRDDGQVVGRAGTDGDPIDVPPVNTPAGVVVQTRGGLLAAFATAR